MDFSDLIDPNFLSRYLTRLYSERSLLLLSLSYPGGEDIVFWGWPALPPPLENKGYEDQSIVLSKKDAGLYDERTESLSLAIGSRRRQNFAPGFQ